MSTTETVSVRGTKAYEDGRPLSWDDVDGVEAQGPVILEVDLSSVPVGALAAVGKALDRVCAETVDARQEGSRWTVRRLLNYGEKQERLAAVQRQYDRGADAFDAIAGGKDSLGSIEEWLLTLFLKRSGLTDPRMPK